MPKRVKEGKVKSILISQPKPETENSPYHRLAKKLGIQIDFRPFIHVEGVPGRDFRKSKINFMEHSAVIFTSRNSIDHFFRVSEELKAQMSQDTKFFCVSEAIALYLQKYTQYRKRKIFFGKTGTAKGMMDILKKHKNERYLFPCSDIHKNDIPEFLEKDNLQYTKAVLYRTVCSDLSDLEDIFYDMIVFFSPSGIKSLFFNFPHFEQKNTRIAAFGPTTCKAVEDAGLRLDIKAPIPQAPSMTMAIEKYLKGVNK